MRYAVISDIHEDVVNLRKAFARIEKIGVDKIVCLGDISGFSARHYSFMDSRNASECLEMVRDKCAIIIAGNHDLHAGRKTPEITPLFSYPDNWYRNDFPTRLKLSEGKVWLYDTYELDALYSREDKAFINSLPEFSVENNILFAHYLYPNLTGAAKQFYIEMDALQEHKRFVIDQGCTISFSGHPHHSGLLIVAEKQIVERRFNRKVQLSGVNSVLVPPIVRGRGGSGFCIFDASQLTIEAKRV
jgi:predicted phosphodiesterase